MGDREVLMSGVRARKEVQLTALFLILLCALATLPFLGLTEFNTKGEPREAVVAMSMLQQDNWILPTNNGGDIPYKPPFFHWCIALVGLLTGGEVTEYASRLPSAVALIVLTAATFLFFVRYTGRKRALLTSLITFTAFEIYRSALNCRVDMMLTMLTVCAIYSLYKWWEAGMHRFPWQAILLMSAATLTKGPVGIIIPCLCVGVFMLIRGVSFFRAFFLLVLWGLLSTILPLCWYAAAYAQGGEEFLRLALEENVGRMTGSMSYEVHSHAWPYNVAMLLSGFAPWTLLCLFAAVPGVAALIRILRNKNISLKSQWRECASRLSAHPAATLALVSALIIFIFYCIPSGKRGVYLMPMYPFVAYYIACMAEWLVNCHRWATRWFGAILAVVASVAVVAFVIVACGLVPESVVGHGKHAAENAAMLTTLAHSGFGAWICVLLTPALIWFIFYMKRQGALGFASPFASALLIVTVYMAMSGAYTPAIMKAKSVKQVAEDIRVNHPQIADNLYEFIAHGEESAGDPVHYFELDFYLGDRIRNFRREQPAQGYLAIPDADTTVYFPQFAAHGYRFEPVYRPDRPLMRKSPSTIYKFSK